MDIIKYSIDFLLLPSMLFVGFFYFQTKLDFNRNSRIASWIMSRGLFYTTQLERGDEILLNVVRIILGCLLLYRLFGIAEFSIPLDPNYKTVAALSLYLIVLLAFTLGVFTPVATLLLLLYQLHFNLVLKTYTLGVDVTAMLLMCLVLYPAGRRLSVDAVLAKRMVKIRSFYQWFVFEERAAQVVTAKAVAFLSYCLLCLYSVLLHLDEPLWLNGNAGVHLLGSSYLSKYYSTFQGLFSSYPVAVWSAKLSMIGMVVWYFLLGPAVLIGGILRKLAFLWTIAFFLLSTFLLQLSILGHIEFLLFGILFWINAVPRNAKSVNMLYDDRCNLCDKTVRFLKAVDLAGILKFRPISKNTEQAKRVGVSPDELRNDLYSWEDGSESVFNGYNFYLHISRRLLVLLPFYPFLLLFKFIGVGPVVYKFIAKRRIEMFGVCTLPVDLERGASPLTICTTSSAKNARGFFRPFLLTTLSFSLLFLAIMPISPLASAIQSKFRNAVQSAHILGWTRINVFNAQDLKMTNHYFTASTIVEGNAVMLPFTGIDGSRLDWHQSERVYFGNSLRWRRSKNVKKDPTTYKKRPRTILRNIEVGKG